MRILLALAVVMATATVARADYCVGTDCASGADGWHLHGCYDFGRKADGSKDYLASGCYRGIVECWDAQDATCQILEDWGAYSVGGGDACEQADNKVAAGSFCADIMMDDLAREKLKREQAAEQAKYDDIDQGFGGGTPNDAPYTSVGGYPSTTTPAPESRPPPPRTNPWTPQGGVPLRSYGNVQLVDFQAKVPCTICVTFTTSPPLDVVAVAESVPSQASAASGMADDANDLGKHVDAVLSSPDPLSAQGTTPPGAPPDPPPEQAPPEPRPVEVQAAIGPPVQPDEPVRVDRSQQEALEAAADTEPTLRIEMNNHDNAEERAKEEPTPQAKKAMEKLPEVFDVNQTQIEKAADKNGTWWGYFADWKNQRPVEDLQRWGERKVTEVPKMICDDVLPTALKLLAQKAGRCVNL